MWRRIGQMALVSTRLRHWRTEYEARARLALGDARFAGAYRDGEALDEDEMLAYALEEPAAPPAPAAAAGSRVALTRRERQVAELIADGLSNKQIAARLMVGTRTAESHVENILTKLGFTSRVQVASWVSREGRDPRDELAGDLS
jgi:DNA-binding NarL/FixJ family response regulator